MPDWLVFAPGMILLVSSYVLTFSGLAVRSSPRILAGNRLRFLAIGVLLILPGIQLAVFGFMGGPQWGQVILGLLVMGFGGLWIIGRTGIPKSPNA
jgi:hypothetical protein